MTVWTMVCTRAATASARAPQPRPRAAGWARRFAAGLAALMLALPAWADPSNPSVQITYNQSTVINNVKTPVAEEMIVGHLWEVMGKATLQDDSNGGQVSTWQTMRVDDASQFATMVAGVKVDLQAWLAAFPGVTGTSYENEGQTNDRRDFVSQSTHEEQTSQTTVVTTTLDTHGAVEGVDYLSGGTNDPTQWIAMNDVHVDLNEVTTITKYINVITTTNYNEVQVWQVSAYRQIQAGPPPTLYTATASAGAGGRITPSSRQRPAGVSASFTLAPAFGYEIDTVAGTCGGTLSGNTYNTTALSADCTVQASFKAASGPIRHFSGPSATGSGTVVVDLSGGGATCGFDGAPALVASAAGASPAKPDGIAFAHGLLRFKTRDCTAGASITLTLQYPAALPAGTQYWKWGPEPGNATQHWYTAAAAISGNTVVLTIKDGGVGDDDLSENGSILDDGGPGAPPGPGPGGATAIPTLGEWALALLSLLLAGLAALQLRRARVF